MPILEVTTKSANQVWASPDGQRVIYALELDYNGESVTAKTYSAAIATPGWKGTVDTYEKQGRNGTETFVKQPPKEGGWQGNSGPQSSGGQIAGSKPAYQPRDDKAIQAQWSIGQAVTVANLGLETDMGAVESLAKEFFAMIERVKTSDQTEAEPAGDAETVGDDELAKIDEIFGGPKEEEKKWPPKT